MTGNGKQQGLRDEIRKRIFNKKPNTRIIKVFDTEVELRQPNLRSILNMRAEGDTTVAVANMLISFCYVPGTNDKVFEEADYDSLLELPFGEGLNTIVTALNELTDLDIEGEEKNLEGTTDSTTSSP